MNLEVERVAIIGAGPVGLITAFHATKIFSEVSIFEKNPEIGGVWSNRGYAWEKMTTNISKYCMGYLNFQWRDYDELFPSKDSVNHFLLEIAEKGEFLSKIRFNTLVKSVERLENGKSFRVVSENSLTKTLKEEEFDYILVCTGMFSKPVFRNFASFIGNPEISLKITHICQYKSPFPFKGKKIIVVGHGHSATQIASDICMVAEKVINVFRKPHWIAKKSNYSKKYKKFLPDDISFYSTKKERLESSKLSFKEKCQLRCNAFHGFLNQNELGIEEFVMEKVSSEPSFIAVSDDYLDFVQKGLIRPIRSEIVSIFDQKVTLANHEVIEADEIILGTGYTIDCSFLDEKLQSDFSYDPNRKNNPLHLEANYVFNRNVKNIAFVGLSPFDAFTNSWEFQAIVALNYLKFGKNWSEYTKRFKVYSREEIDYQDLLDFNDKIAEEARHSPDYQFIEKDDPELFDALMNGPFRSGQHFLTQENRDSEVWKENAELIKKYYKEMKRSFFV